MLVSSNRYLYLCSRVNCVAGQDDLRQERSQTAFHREATTHMNTADRWMGEVIFESKFTGDASAVDYLETVTYLTRGLSCVLNTRVCTYTVPGVLQLSTRDLDDALRTFDGLLSKKPTNLVALLGKVSVLYIVVLV